MKRIVFTIFVVGWSLMGTTKAQMVETPVKIDLGLGGGVTLPTGTLSDIDNTGWHAGAKARFHGFMPLSIVASGNYHRLPNKVGSESDTQLMLGAGLEYPIPSVAVKPYFGVDGFVNVSSNSAPNSQSFTREGIGLGGGIEFSIPAFGSFDTSVKYQILNLMGKDANEQTIYQIAGNVSFMFSVM